MIETSAMAKNIMTTDLQRIIEQELIFSCSDATKEQWLSALSTRINELISDDFASLISLLYRLDIDELKLTGLLIQHPGTDAGETIGNLIIERQSEKLESRKAFRQDDTHIDEKEKW